MPVPGVYLDECVRQRLAVRLRARGVRVTTTQAEGNAGSNDESQLLYATQRDLTILTHDQRGFRRLHAIFRQQGRPHAGILLLPATPLDQLEVRTAMMLAWIADQPDYRS